MSDTNAPAGDSKLELPTPLGFCWVEIPVKDMKRALKFYGDAFGWTSQEQGEAWYQIVQNEFKNLNGALRLVTEEEHVAGTAARHTMKPFIGLHSIKEPLAKVKEAGGEIINPGEEIPGDMGFCGEFYDSERNVVGVWAKKMSLD
ncbi:hypothetical protein AOL_s00170g90 [Orbilia oligospora ATCC 24927]|uniref:VOC domain-containing protein n=1 Tax=Arthrobotrys oligospora (strain ATCC 24927 / CBS 115.81 / DSM 1491) TaxID=756982 RepID=G1XNC4_ARTOA|nr:hypothetical protein AOL_s00170g90 [Orbilia oligospora ATCC 24927]EGX45383.1 hypothetical protein AOL_s00170g90 [Orbilia oligospora ATCC 24927]